MQVAMKGVSLFGSQVAVNSPNSEVHLGEPPGSVVGFLAIDADVADSSTMSLNKFLGLHEHAAGSAAWVIYASSVRREHLDEKPHNRSRRVKLTTALALRSGELGQKVLVHASEKVSRSALFVAEAYLAKHVNKLPQSSFVEPRVSVVLGEHATEFLSVSIFDGEHCIIYGLADSWLLCLALE